MTIFILQMMKWRGLCPIVMFGNLGILKILGHNLFECQGFFWALIFIKWWLLLSKEHHFYQVVDSSPSCLWFQEELRAQSKPYPFYP